MRCPSLNFLDSGGNAREKIAANKPPRQACRQVSMQEKEDLLKRNGNAFKCSGDRIENSESPEPGILHGNRQHNSAIWPHGIRAHTRERKSSVALDWDGFLHPSIEC